MQGWKFQDKVCDCQGKEVTFSDYSKYKSSSPHISWKD